MNQPQKTGISTGQLFLLTSLIFGATAFITVFSSGSNFGGGHIVNPAPKPAATRLAKALVELDAGPQLTDEDVNLVVQAVMDRAAEGDIEAATFIVELAARQRAANEDAPEAESDADSTRLAKTENQ